MAGIRANLAGILTLRDYLAQHWQGGFTLGYAVWVNGVLGSLGLELFFRLLRLGFGLGDLDDGRPGSLAFLLGSTSVLVVAGTWQFVGVWRSARRHASREGQRHWAALACLFVISGTVLIAWDVALTSGRLGGSIG